MKLLKKIFDSEVLLLVVMILAITLIGVSKTRADSNSPIGTSTIMYPDFPTDFEYEYYTVAFYVGNDGKEYNVLFLSNEKPPMCSGQGLCRFYGKTQFYILNNNSWKLESTYDNGCGFGRDMTYYYFNYDLVRTSDNSVFHPSPLKSQAFLATKVGTLKVILTTLTSLASLLVVSLISWIGLRKCWIFLLKVLRIS